MKSKKWLAWSPNSSFPLGLDLGLSNWTRACQLRMMEKRTYQERWVFDREWNSLVRQCLTALKMTLDGNKQRNKLERKKVSIHWFCVTLAHTNMYFCLTEGQNSHILKLKSKPSPKSLTFKSKAHDHNIIIFSHIWWMSMFKENFMKERF